MQHLRQVFFYDIANAHCNIASATICTTITTQQFALDAH